MTFALYAVVGKSITLGSCVLIPDGRTGRVRGKSGKLIQVRVRRKESKSHQFLYFQNSKLKEVSCPEGWMSRDGYNRYLKKTLAKMAQRKSKNK